MELQPGAAQPFLALPSAYTLSPIPQDICHHSSYSSLTLALPPPNLYCSHSQYIPPYRIPLSKQKDPAGHGGVWRVCPVLHIESHHFLPRWQMLLPQTTQLRENSLQMLSYRLSNLHTHPTPLVNTTGRSGMAGWDRRRWQHSPAASRLCSVPKTQPISKSPPPVPVGAISSHTLTAAAGFCLQPNTQKC